MSGGLTSDSAGNKPGRPVKTADSEVLLNAELEQISWSRKLRGQQPPPQTEPDRDLVGLAISGGGIRSASLALGIIQSFARVDLLKRFDYLSTVSGGGYIGSSLSWLLRREHADAGFGLDHDTFPYGTDWPGEPKQDGPKQRSMMRYLRQHGNYLTPGKGLNELAAASAVLRAILVNLAVWVPVVTLILWASMLSLDLSDFRFPYQVCCVGEVPCGDAGAQCPGPTATVEPAVWPFDELGGVFGALAVLFVLVAVVYSIITSLRRVGGYAFRRWVEKSTGKALGLTVVVGILASLPLAASYLSDQMILASGTGAALLGIGSGVFTFLRSASSNGRIPTNVIAVAGSGLLLYGLLFVGYWCAIQIHAGNLFETQPWLLALFALALLSGLFANLNHIGLHRYYRDRLMETFLPPTDRILNGEGASYTGPSPKADHFAISALAADVPEHAHPGPYHLVNTNVVLVDSHNRRYRMRGGDSFLLSPLYCGSPATQWIDSKAFVGNGMTLPTAMSISGAAANPNTGVGGVGLTRSKAVSILMALLNIRLGYWVSNPKHSQFFRVPNHFTSALHELGSRYREDVQYLQLTDGGHFENLALYELIRRRVQVIVVTDGGEDGGFVFGDLRNALDRIRTDFGVQVEFDDKNQLEAVMPYERDEPHYPPGASWADRSHIVGDIKYPELDGKPAKTGKLIYCKSTMLGNVGIRTKGYKATNPAFPHESTADQFFSEEQLEAYRMLGCCIGEEALSDLRAALDPLPGSTGATAPCA